MLKITCFTFLVATIVALCIIAGSIMAGPGSADSGLPQPAKESEGAQGRCQGQSAGQKQQAGLHDQGLAAGCQDGTGAPSGARAQDACEQPQEGVSSGRRGRTARHKMRSNADLVARPAQRASFPAPPGFPLHPQTWHLRAPPKSGGVPPLPPHLQPGLSWPAPLGPLRPVLSPYPQGPGFASRPQPEMFGVPGASGSHAPPIPSQLSHSIVYGRSSLRPPFPRGFHPGTTNPGLGQLGRGMPTSSSSAHGVRGAASPRPPGPAPAPSPLLGGPEPLQPALLQPLAPRGAYPSADRHPTPETRNDAAGQRTGTGRSVAQRLIRLMSFGKERLLEELRSNQLSSDDDEEPVRVTHRWQRKEPTTRGPLSEGNRPRTIWAIPEVQSLMLEILASAGLNLYDEDGDLRKDPKTDEPYKNLQKKYTEDARDILESLLRSDFVGNCWVRKMERKAEDALVAGGHFLRADSVGKQLIRFMDRLLNHMETLKLEPERETGNWRVQLLAEHKAFIMSRLVELTEYIPPEERRYPTEEVRYTHFQAFVTKYRDHLPPNMTPAYLRMYVMTEVDTSLPLEVWAQNTINCKVMLDKACGRDGTSLPPGWAHPTPVQLANIVRMYKCCHPLRRQDRPLKFAISATNQFCQHYGLSAASIDKIEDGKDLPGYRIFVPKYEEFLAEFEADPDDFYLTYAMVRRMGNIQLSILFDNLAKAEADFELYAAYMYEIGQFVPDQYAQYFGFDTLAAAQEDVEEKMAASRSVVEGNFENSMGENSWFARQMKRRKGDRTRAKGRQLRPHVTMDHLVEMLEFQRNSCHYSGETIFLARGGKRSPHAGTAELVGPSRAVKLAANWLARGFISAPLVERKEFLEYWGVQGHLYVNYLVPDGEGGYRDLYEEKSLEILGQDQDGNLIPDDPDEAAARDRSGDEAGGSAGSESAGTTLVRRSGRAEESGRSGTAVQATAALPFGGFDGSWGDLEAGHLHALTAEKPPPAPRYRRQGLSIDSAPPSLGGVPRPPRSVPPLQGAPTSAGRANALPGWSTVRRSAKSFRLGGPVQFRTLTSFPAR